MRWDLRTKNDKEDIVEYFERLTKSIMKVVVVKEVTTRKRAVTQAKVVLRQLPYLGLVVPRKFRVQAPINAIMSSTAANQSLNSNASFNDKVYQSKAAIQTV